MGNIVLLDENTINKIAAGEVVDRPASIVKELVENSIDAGATQITVEIKNGGISYIRITDNGHGIRKDDVEIAFERHATSKIRKEEDIQKITSMGFRGEALASVASISKVTLVTRHKEEEVGTKIIVEGGNAKELEETGYNIGTSIVVENVFYNVPARYKFLKKDYTEAGYIEDVVTRLALSNPQVAIKYINNGKTVIQISQGSDIKRVTYSIFGKETAQNLIDVSYEYEGVVVSGVIGNPSLARSTRQNEFTYINSRFIKDKTMSKAIEDGFEQSLSIGKFPFAIIDAKINPNEVDVNVHPAKLEVKFQDEGKIYKAIYYATKNAIKGYEKSISPFSTDKVQTVYRDQRDNTNANNQILEKLDTSYKPEEKRIVDFNYINTIKQSSQSAQIVEPSEKNKDAIENSFEMGSSQIEIKHVQEEIQGPNIEIQYKYVGSLFNTYIIIEIKDRMYIIDQHAAHERLLYERIKENYYGKDRETQMLMVPTLIELKNAEKELVDANIEMFEKSGFILEDFGDNGIKICGIPNVGYNIGYKEMFMDALDELMGASKTVKEEKEKRFLATLACKAAIKGNMGVTREEHVALLGDMMRLNNPFTCPHGRPTAYEISKYEIERKFLRK